MKGFNCLKHVAYRLRKIFASQSNGAIKCVVLSYCKSRDDLRLYFWGDVKDVQTFDDDELILLCYYAPFGNWKKWYGNDWCWSLNEKRIALDILNNTVLYKRYLELNGMEALPKWLRVEVERWL